MLEPVTISPDEAPYVAAALEVAIKQLRGWVAASEDEAQKQARSQMANKPIYHSQQLLIRLKKLNLVGLIFNDNGEKK